METKLRVFAVVINLSAISTVFFMVHTNRQPNTSRSSPTAAQQPRILQDPVLRNLEESPLSQEPAATLLLPNLVPRNVFIVWCGGRRLFQFHNYLSVLSILRFVRPYDIVFYYEQEPIVDTDHYNTWLDEIKQKIAFFHLKKLPKGGTGCLNGKPRPQFIRTELERTGGLYVNEEILLLPGAFMKLRNFTRVEGIRGETGRGFLMDKGPVKRGESRVKSISCTDQLSYRENAEEVCIAMPTVVFPKDIWDLDTDFGRIARILFYGTPAIITPRQSYSDLIPNIAHLVWVGGGEMSFTFYLCALSLLYVVEVKMLYIHGETPPTGPYWNRLKGHPRITTVYRPNYQLVFNQHIKTGIHVSDVWRVDILMRFGGIYVDTDVIFVRPIERELRSYDVVSVYALATNGHFPHMINFGATMGKRNAPFWRLFQQSLKWYKDDDFLWNGVRQPYKIAERYPDLIKIHPNWQIMCKDQPLKCYPSWAPGYPDSQITLNGPVMAWTNATHLYHFVGGDPLKNEKFAWYGKGQFAEMGRMVLQKAKVGMKRELFKKY